MSKARRPRLDLADGLDPRNWGRQLSDGVLWRQERQRQHEVRYAAKQRAKARKPGHLDRVARQGDWKAVQAVAHKALDATGEYAPGSSATVQWDVSGKCAMPRTVLYQKKGVIMVVEITVPCRTECEWCLRQRRREWTARALSELRQSVRTWFGSITLRPEEHYKARCRAVLRASRAAVDFEALQPGEQLRRVSREIGGDLTKWIKRVRKVSGAPLRYCLVMEAHESGLPHYHILVHEIAADLPVTKRHLQEAWHLGFTNFKLVPPGEEKPAFYVCKYLAKSALARVRASSRYGEKRTQS